MRELTLFFVELGMMHMDDPEWVVKKIVHAIEKERDEAYLGFPESLFARINVILPGIVSRGIIKQVPALISFTQQKRRFSRPGSFAGVSYSPLRFLGSMVWRRSLRTFSRALCAGSLRFRQTGGHLSTFSRFDRHKAQQIDRSPYVKVRRYGDLHGVYLPNYPAIHNHEISECHPSSCGSPASVNILCIYAMTSLNTSLPIFRVNPAITVLH